MSETRERTDSRADDARADAPVVIGSFAYDGFDLTHQVVRGWHLVVARGDLDAEAAVSLRSLLESIASDGGSRIILDVARADTITADCVRALAAIDAQLRQVSGDLRLVVDGVAVLHAIREAGLSGRFEVHRYVGDIVGAVPGLDEGGRGKRRDTAPRR
jgi:anti-anti-sigma factor